MSIDIPKDFDVYKQDLEVNELFVRDKLQLNIENWVKFRFTIHVGNNVENLVSDQIISEDVKESYRELAKSHYEVITSLGCCKLALDNVKSYIRTAPLIYKKELKDFYFHIGCLLDNLAHLIYILNDSNSATETNKYGHQVRHWIDWGQLKDYDEYKIYKRDSNLNGIINIRNMITHSWKIPEVYDKITRKGPYWPLKIRTERVYYWPYDEYYKMFKKYKKWILILETVENDLKFIERFQNDIFGKLIKSVHIFEKNYSIEII